MTNRTPCRGLPHWAAAVLALLTVASSAGVIVPAPAGAFPNDVEQYCRHDYEIGYWRFWGTWPEWAKQSFRDGANDWRLSYDDDGTQLIQINESTTMGPLTTWEDLPPNVNGSNNCTYNTIKIDSGFDANQAVRGVARHELGHYIGLHHTGTADSHNGLTPAMSTCVSEVEQQTRVKSQDDVGSLGFAHSHDGTLTPISPMMANFGFENGTSFWGYSGGSMVYYTTGGITGPGNIVWQPHSPTTDYVYQTMRYADAPSKTVYARFNHKAFNTTDYSTAGVELWSRDIDYATTSTCSLSAWPNGKNMNSATITGSWVKRQNQYSTSIYNWSSGSTANYVSNSDGEEDLQIRLFSDPKALSGERSWIQFDNATVQCANRKIEGDCQ